MHRPPLYDDVNVWLVKTADHLGVDGGCFHLKSQAGDRIVCQAVTDSMYATDLSYGLDLTDCAAIRQVLGSGAVLAVDDATADQRVARVARERFGLKSILYCPVRVRNAYDAVAIFSHRKPHAWRDAELALASGAVTDLQGALSSTRRPLAKAGSTYNLMLSAIPGLVSIVDQNLLTQATSASVSPGQALLHQPAAVSVNELLRDADRGHELRDALLDILRGDREQFRALLRTPNGTWWVHVRRATVPGGDEPLAVVHTQPLPVATEALMVQEERLRLEALGRIVGSVAHEVNNALQHIGLSVNAMQTDAYEHERSVIGAATERAARITRKLLTFARQAPSQFARTELTDLVNQELDLARQSVGRHHFINVRLRRRAMVRVDVRKIELLIINLCRNAAEASPPGSDIIIEAGVETRNGREWGVLAVIDAGSGMPPNVAARLGELQYTTKAEGVGAGIGLSVVKQIADEHGADMVIEAGDHGIGTRVGLYLPLEDERADKPPPAGATTPRILIVDDEVELVRMIDRALGLRGYQIQRCTSLAAATTAFDEAPGWPDVIVFDVNLGDGSGIDLLAHVKAVRPDVACVAISGFASHDAARPLAEANCPLLPKPFSLDELYRAVEQALRRTDAT